MPIPQKSSIQQEWDEATPIKVTPNSKIQSDWDSATPIVNSQVSLNGDDAQKAADSLIYSNMLNMTPSEAYQNHDSIAAQLKGRLGNYAEAGWEGLTKESILGELWRGKLPEPFEAPDEVSRWIEGLGRMAGDLPVFIAGGIAGGAAGGIAGTAEFPVIGTVSGSVIGFGAGGFALNEGMRKWLVDKYSGNKVSSFTEVMDILKASGKGAIVGGATAGVGGIFTEGVEGVAGGALSGIARARAYKAAAELATMTTVGSLVEGRVPTKQDFIDNAAMFAAMHIGMEGLDYAKEAAPALRDRMYRIYGRDGVHPAEVTGTAAAKAMESQPDGNPTEIINQIENEIAQRATVSASNGAESTEGTPSEGPPKPSETTDSESAQTGIKNAVTESEREERGLSPVEIEARKEPAFDAARKAVDSSKIDPRALATELAENPRPHTDEEAAALVYDRMRLMNEHATIMDGIEDAREKGDTEREAREKERLAANEEATNTNDEAARRSGTESGRGLAARKMMIQQDYSLSNVLQRARVASSDGTVSPELRDRLGTLTTQLDAANKRIDEYEESKKQDAGQQTVERIKARQARAGQRAATKSDLKVEREDLYRQLNSELMQLSANPVLNPKLYELFGKIATNHIRDGIVTIEGIVDEIHANIQDKGISKREIRDYISQYGRTTEMSRDEVSKNLSEARRQGKLISAIEDAQDGERPSNRGSKQQPTSERVKELRKELDQAMRDAGMKTTSEQSPESRLQAYKTRIENQIKEMEKRLKTGDFTKPTRKTLVLDQEALDRKEEAEKLKGQIEEAILKRKRENETVGEKLGRFVRGWRVGVLISSVGTFGKVAGAGAAKVAATPVINLINEGVTSLPVYSEIAEKASPRWSRGFEPKAEAKAFGTLFERRNYLQIWDAIKTGKIQIDRLYGEKGTPPPEFLSFIGHTHAAAQVLPKIAEFNRSLEMNAQEEIEKGNDPENPKIAAAIAGRAYADAQRETWNNPNWLNSGFKSFLRTIEAKGGGNGKFASFMLKIEFPIVNKPANIAGELSDYVIGAEKGAIQGLRFLFDKNALKNLTMEQADNILRAMSRGLLGHAFLALGYYAATNVGGWIQATGFHQYGDKNPDHKEEKLVVGGVEIPKNMQESAFMQMIQMGATVKMVNDTYSAKGASASSALGTGALSASLGVAKRLPFMEGFSQTAQAMQRPENAESFFDELVKSLLIPPDVRKLAQYMDKDSSGNTIERKPTNLKESIEADVPGFREDVPIGGKNRSKPSYKFSIRSRR